MMMVYTGHVFGLWDDPLTAEVQDGTLGYVFTGMFIMILAMETLMIFVYWALLRATKGMELRQLRTRGEAAGAGVAEVLDSRGISYEEEVFDKEHRGAFFHERFFVFRYSFRGYDAAISRVRSFSGNDIILIGPIDDLNRSFVKRLQIAIDEEMFGADGLDDRSQDHSKPHNIGL